MAGARPQLIVVYDRASITPMELFEAARPVADLIWVMDFSDAVLGPLLPLIRRMGAVVDSAGLGEGEVVARVAAGKPDGVIVFAERQIALAAAIAAALNLRFHSPSTAGLLANKYRQRAALARAGVPGPQFWPVSADTGAAAKKRLASELHYPVVLKPQEGLASRDTSQVPDADTLLRLLDDPGVCDDMLVEELLAESRPRDEQRLGETLMVDSLVSHGGVVHHTVCGHFIPASPFRGTGSFTPIHLGKADTGAVLAATDAALVALGIEQGFTNTDLILTPGGPRVLEVNGRIGGEVQTLRELVGVSGLLREAMKFAVGVADVDVSPLDVEAVAFCVNHQPPMEAQRLRGLSGLDEISRLPGVTRVLLHRHPGDSLDWRDGTMSRLCSVYGVASDHDHLHELHTQIELSIRADYDLAH